MKGFVGLSQHIEGGMFVLFLLGGRLHSPSEVRHIDIPLIRKPRRE
jgi:hypothetical protein